MAKGYRTKPIADRAARGMAISSQVDYYFSAANLLKEGGDPYLEDLIAASAHNEKGAYWIPISRIAYFDKVAGLFPRIKGESGPKHNNVLGVIEIMEALQNSRTVDVMDNEHIRRKVDGERLQRPANSDDTQGKGEANRQISDLNNKVEALSCEPNATTKTSTSAQVLNGADVSKYNKNHTKSVEDGVWDENDKQKLYIAPSLAKPVKKMKAVTGYEKNFADAPITPAEHEENLDCYHPDRPVHDRLEVAIQRYKARRKFHTSHTTLFNAWLKFGGVETGERKFNGKLDDKEKIEGMSAFDKAIEFATHQVGDDKGDPNLWVVDFQGVAEAYLSSEFPSTFFDPDAEQIELQCTIMTNFYNYLMHHDVCPEYLDAIKAACDVVKLGCNQLISIHNMGKLLPGAFNVACSVLLEGNLATSRGVSYAAPGLEFESNDFVWNPTNEKLLTSEKARATIKTACSSSLASDELFDVIAESGDLSSIMNMAEAFDLGLEVVEIHRPTEDDIDFYHKANLDEVQIRKDVILKPLGRLVCKPWKIPSYEDHDLPKNLRDLTFKNAPETFTFWIEGDIIDHMHWQSKELVLNEETGKTEEKIVTQNFVGMKMSARVRRLRVEGVKECLWVLDGVNNVYCSFYNLILNDLMSKPWKGVHKLTQEEQAKGSDDGF
ncbi:hypothetical protein FKW77_002434 [Venturia effusa]|uniref:HTH La-type RNA-binding domain-containing protein n=1 Tax=Venturia effusa TaxID=50376 RepID=A0A517LC30_9PEZI|nr:hypothetical protein FKW77_002434 [Venturia effusa]